MSVYNHTRTHKHTGTEFIDAYFKAATVCSRATEKKLSMMEEQDHQSSAEDVLSVQLTSGGAEKLRLHSDDENDTSGEEDDDDDDDDEIPKPDTPAPPTPIKIKVPKTITTRPTIKGRHAILVLGPSAVGKTFSTKNALATVLERNGWMSDMMFLSIDGGIMRETSKTWNTMKELPRQVRGDYRYKGVSDLFSGYFKPTISGMKKKVFKYCVKSGKNIIVPETGASPLPGVPGKVKSMLKLLKKYDYRVVMTAVSGSRERCRLNGTSREVKEGKKYNGMTWKWASDKVTKCFNYARSIGYTKETFFITDNTDWDDVRTTIIPPHYGINCTWSSFE